MAQRRSAAGLAVAGVVISVVWLPIAYLLGKRYENINAGEVVGKNTPATAK